jgi:acetyl-CoA carboxylase biotin carboxyl carrier protein
MEEIKTNGKKVTVKPGVNELFELMKTEDLQELEIKEGDFYVYLKRKGKNAPVLMQYQPPVAAPVVQAQEQPEIAEQKSKAETIKSPIIGTFYRSPSPASPSFAKEGDIIDPGKTLCIVEAMKVMNEIKAEARIKITKILVENGKPVVSNQDLFEFERA